MERLTRAKAIRAKCLDCSCGDRTEVRLCPITDCPLWIYRMGKEVEPGCSNLPQNDERSDKIEG